MRNHKYKLKQIQNFIAFQLFARLANVVMLVVLTVFGFIFYRSLPFLTSGVDTGNNNKVNNTGLDLSRIVEIFSSGHWFPNAEIPEFGMLSLFYGSFIVTITAMIFAIPIGILSSVVLSDIVSFRVRQILKPFIELPAAIPSVAFGFFAIKIVAPFLQDNFGFSSGTNVLNASLILAIMAIPTIVSVSEDAMSGIGREIREASYALGATRAETIINVVFPAAWNGIAAAIILGTMRAVGETMVVWMAAGNAANMPEAWYRIDQVIAGFGGAVRTMTATIAGDIGETPAESLHRSALFTVGLLLLIFTFFMNLLTEFIVNRSKNKSYKDNVSDQSSSESKFLINENSNIVTPCNSRFYFRVCCFFYRFMKSIISKPAKFLSVIFLVMNRVIAFSLQKISILFPFWILNSSRFIRRLFNFGFTSASLLSILILFFALGIVIIPIFRGGIEAVYFQETAEHRLFILEKFQRGNRQEIEQEFIQCTKFRKPIYERLKKLSWLSPDEWIDQAAKIGRETNNRQLSRMFKKLCEADSLEQLQTAYDKIKNLQQDNNENINPIVHLAGEYYAIARDSDLSIRNKFIPADSNLTYSAAFKQIRTIINGVEGTGCILGKEERNDNAHLPPEVRYGAAHWSTAQKYLLQLKQAVIWKPKVENGKSSITNEKIIVNRFSLFAETKVEPEVKLLIEEIDKGMTLMLNPRWTFYGYYFFDSAAAGHFLGGIGPELLGTALISLLSILIALPLGLLTAAYLVEAAKDNSATRFMRLCVNTLAGVPSIVFGLFGLAMIVEFITGKPSLLAGSITLAILILPVMIRTSEEAIRAVPQMYREAAIGLGAGALRVFMTVTLPAALPGILTGTILGISRAAGETAPLLFTCAVASGGFIAGSNLLFQPTPVLSYTAYDMAVGDRIAAMVPYNQFGLVATLILFVLVFNVAAIIIRARITKKLRGN
ncbi:MAG: phosphate ABC transporter permease subunit PstC [Planctomycetaceae bacterium]|jgi:phosphate ABC transporter permease protein PstC/phosphate ABC transporter permease subunit PstA|nr:phosphate ABC transporter permease subunit PstC [Planctomycetaceae bacterium]